MPSHGSTQPPLRHTSPYGQTTPIQLSMQLPPWHTCPVGHSLLAQAGSTHTPRSVQTRSCAQRNSPVPQLGTQRPRSQMKPVSHRSPSSTSPLQSSSRALHFSALGWMFCRHSSSPFLHCSVPSLHTPSRPVSQASPPPVH